MKKLLLIMLLGCGILPAISQNTPTLKPIKGGTVRLGGGYQYAIKDYYLVLLGNDDRFAAMNQGQTVIGEVPSENNPDRQVTVASFYMAETEVTNAQYRAFVVESLLSHSEAVAFRKELAAADPKAEGAVQRIWAPVVEKAMAAGIFPDLRCWTSEFVFASNEPLVKHYFFHPSFDNYPVVGVSWQQAKAYCAWLTATNNANRAAKHLPEAPAYRLPTEAEWEFAARELNVNDNEFSQNAHFPWVGASMVDEKGQYRANIKTGPSNYIGDNYEYTAPCKSFAPNSKGLYQMAGNVSEWCEDVFVVNAKSPTADVAPTYRSMRELEDPANQVVQRVVKGGSWADMMYAAMAGSRMGWLENQGGSRIGFRVAMTKVGCDCKNGQHCKHAVNF